MAKRNETPDQQEPQHADFTAEERVAYFERKLGYWQGKVGRLLHPPKVKHAKRRVAHYAAKLAEAQKALA